MDLEPIHVTVPASPDDPREEQPPPPGVVIHRAPALHPDDVTIVDGIRVTTVARTLIDLAEDLDKDELRRCFARADELEILDLEELADARRRVEWRPSLAMLDEVIAEFE